MRRGLRIYQALLAVLFVLPLLACGAVTKVREAAARTQFMNDMKQIALAVHNYQDLNRKTPSNAQDIIPFLAGGTAAGRLQNGEVTMVYNFDFAKEPPNALIGWSNSPIFGGNICVIQKDGVVQQMTSAEFAAAKQAKPKAASTPDTPPEKNEDSDPVTKPPVGGRK